MKKAELMVAPGCQHCASMLRLLSDLVEQGQLASLTVTNIVLDPAPAERYRVRSVPWLKLGRFEFSGLLDKQELRQWTELSDDETAFGSYLREQLKQGSLDNIIHLVERQPTVLRDLLGLLEGDGEELPLTVRIGISAVIESQQDNPQRIRSLLPVIGRLAKSADPATRADACHFLALGGGQQARDILRQCLTDEVSMVREIAAESLQEIADRQAD